MLDVHQSGRAVVSSGTRERMELDVTTLHGYGLWATPSTTAERPGEVSPAARRTAACSSTKWRRRCWAPCWTTSSTLSARFLTTDPVRQRLFPDGYRDDEDAAAEFRELTEAGLRDDKAARAERCRAELPAGSGRATTGRPDAAERWLTVLNDLRLALGTRLGVTEDEPADIDPADPRAQSWVVYYWLTTLQDGLVQTAMR